MTNTVIITKMASTTEQLNTVMSKTIEELENEGYIITETSDTKEILKTCTIQKKKGYQDEENTTEVYNYVFAKDIVAVKEEL
ncbi:MAG: hypothetical protein J6Y02_23760 [Pseudobutyrivibrio sp.]|nr:hypothetical protein [Pseudobutyrivibrio sp.]